MKSENAIKNENYLGILFILYTFKGINKTHLRFLFLENHGIEIISSNGRLTKTGKKIKETFGRFFELNFYNGFDTSRSDIFYGKILGPRINTKSGDNYLSKILRDLRFSEPFPIIKREKLSGEKATYHLTPKGEAKFLEFLLFWLLKNNHVSTEYIQIMINQIIMDNAKYHQYDWIKANIS